MSKKEKEEKKLAIFKIWHLHFRDIQILARLNTTVRCHIHFYGKWNHLHHLFQEPFFIQSWISNKWNEKFNFDSKHNNQGSNLHLRKAQRRLFPWNYLAKTDVWCSEIYAHFSSKLAEGKMNQSISQLSYFRSFMIRTRISKCFCLLPACLKPKL